MKNKRNMDFTYKGIVCKSETENDMIKLGVLYEKQIYFMTISDHENIYEQLSPNQVGVCIVEFRDGTEPIDFMTAKNIKFNEVFIWVYDLTNIKLDELDGYLLSFVLNEPENMPELVDAVEKVYVDIKIIEKIKEHKNYTKTWVETH